LIRQTVNIPNAKKKQSNKKTPVSPLFYAAFMLPVLLNCFPEHLQIKFTATLTEFSGILLSAGILIGSVFYL